MTRIKDIIDHTFTVRCVSVNTSITITLIHYASTDVQRHKQGVEGEQRKSHYPFVYNPSAQNFCWWQARAFQSQPVCLNRGGKAIFFYVD